jgi:hypothetical protein
VENSFQNSNIVFQASTGAKFNFFVLIPYPGKGKRLSLAQFLLVSLTLCVMTVGRLGVGESKRMGMRSCDFIYSLGSMAPSFWEGDLFRRTSS